jgi:TPR repeat protein
MFKLLLIVAFSVLIYAQEGALKEYNLGIKYLATQNMPQAFKHLTRAADLNNSDAQYNLALMYYRGDGVKQDIYKSAALLERAAKQGQKKAIANVGRIYMQLLQFDKAQYWLKINAQNGDEGAKLLLDEIDKAKN